MNIKILAISLLLSIIWASSNAQVEKQVEVTRAYIPQIEPATKLKLEPDMSDTVRLRPEIDYSVTPRSIETVLSTRLYKPATVTYWEFNRAKRAYLKAGIGLPISSVADIYVSNSNPNTNYIVGYLNHAGRYAKVENDYGERLSASNTQNRIGVAAGTYLGEQMLEGEIYYNLDRWSRYATANPRVANPTYQTVGLSGRYGDEFVDFLRWNYNFDFDTKYLFNGEDDSDVMINLGSRFGGEIGYGTLVTEIEYSYISGYGDGVNNYLNNSVLIAPTYSFNLGDWSIDAGVKLYYDYLSNHFISNSNVHFTPHIKAIYESNAKIQPFVDLDGTLNRNNYAALTVENPYIYEGAKIYNNTMNYTFRGGISGLLANDKLSYSLFAEYENSQNALFWYLVENGEYDNKIIYDNYYSVLSGELHGLSANLDMEYRPMGDLTIKFGGKATKYTASNSLKIATGRPVAEFYIGGEYNLKSMRFALSADVKGARYTSRIVTLSGVSDISDVQTPTTLNLKASGEVDLKNNMSLFMELDNIANAKLYEWMGYREYGIGVMVGIKMEF